MKSRVRALIETVRSMARDRRIRFKVISALAVLLFLQLYFVRELLAAEILFGVGFLSLLLLGGVLYALGEIGERGFNLTEAGVRVLAVSARLCHPGRNEPQSAAADTFSHNDFVV